MADYVRLEIIKGIPPVPGDTSSNLESLDDVLDLLNARGFSVKEDGWIPKLPQTKGGGVYARNPNEDDSVPISLPLDNVMETITITSSAATPANRYWLEMRLNRLAQAARDFWEGRSNQPVQFVYRAPGAPGAQYALIYDINVAKNNEELASAASKVSEITFTIRREGGWRGIAAGENPKHWSYIHAGNEAGFTAATADLSSGSDHLAYATIYNKTTFDSLYVISATIRDFIDIPAAAIPGDLPALVNIVATPTSWNHDLYVAKSTKETTRTDRAGNSLPLYHALPLAAATMQHADATLGANGFTGIVHTPKSASNNVMTFAATATAERYVANWAVGGTGMPHLNHHILRGTFAIIARCHRVGGTGSMSIRLEILQNGTVMFNSGNVAMQVSGNGPLLHNMGVVTLPTSVPATVSVKGKGIQVENDLDFKLYMTRPSGTDGGQVSDIILLPIDEGLVELKQVGALNFATIAHVYDNTGYFVHGKPDSSAFVSLTTLEDNLPVEPAGGDIYLTPGVNNRLIFLSFTKETTIPGVSYTNVTWDVKINIVPRWSGVRDE